MNRILRCGALLVAAVALAALGACSPSSSARSAAKKSAATMPSVPLATVGSVVADDGSPAGRIEVKNTAFSPTANNIISGQALVWHFDDGMAHTVTGDGFDSGPQTTGFFTHTFAKAGKFDYHCSIHPTMKGAITVT